MTPPDAPAAAVADTTPPLGDLPAGRIPSEADIDRYPQRPVDHTGSAAVRATVADEGDWPPRGLEGWNVPQFPDVGSTPPGDSSGPPSPPDRPDAPKSGAGDEPSEPFALQAFEHLANGGYRGEPGMQLEANRQAQHDTAALSQRLDHLLGDPNIRHVDPGTEPTLARPIISAVADQLDDPIAFAGDLGECVGLCERVAAYADEAEQRPVVVTPLPVPIGLNVPVAIGQYEIVSRSDGTLEVAEALPEDLSPSVQRLVRHQDGGTVQFIHPDGMSREVIAPTPEGGHAWLTETITTLPLGTAEYLRSLADTMRQHNRLLVQAETHHEGIVPDTLVDELRQSTYRLWSMLQDGPSTIAPGESPQNDGLARVTADLMGYGQAVQSARAFADHARSHDVYRPGDQPGEVESSTRRIANQSDTLFAALDSLGIPSDEREITVQVEKALDKARAHLDNPAATLAEVEKALDASQALQAYVIDMEGRVVHNSHTVTFPPGIPCSVGQYTIQPTPHGLKVTEQLPDRPHPNQVLTRHNLPGDAIHLQTPDGGEHWHVQQTPDGGLEVVDDVFVGLAPGTTVFFQRLTLLLDQHTAILKGHIQGVLSRGGAQAQLMRNLLMADVLCSDAPEAPGGEPQPSLHQIRIATEIYIAAMLDRS